MMKFYSLDWGQFRVQQLIIGTQKLNSCVLFETFAHITPGPGEIELLHDIDILPD